MFFRRKPRQVPAESSSAQPVHVRRERLAVENEAPNAVTFILEPWANELPLAPGERLVVEGKGPQYPDGFYVERSEEYLVVWAWDGADARVLREDGSIVGDWTGLPCPDFRELERRRAQERGE